MAYRPTRKNIVRGSSVVTNVSLSSNLVIGSAYVSPDITSIAENAKRMREALLSNIEAALRPSASEIQSRLRSSAPWNDQPSSLHNPERGYPNDNASKQLLAKSFFDASADRVGIAVYHSSKTFQIRKSGKDYYGNFLESKFGYLSDTLGSEVAPLVFRYMEGRVLEDITFKGAAKTNRRPRRARTVIVRRTS